jgi:uncharacterized protein involved in exopolysaccharide biosynthesis
MQEFSLNDLVAPLKRYWVMIIGASFLVAALAVLHTYFFVPTTWETDTSIVFEDSSGGTAGMLRQLSAISNLAPSAGGRGEFIQILLQSRTVRGRVVDELGLVESLGTSRSDAVERLGQIFSANLPASGIMVIETKWSDKPRAALARTEPEAPETLVQITRKMIEVLEQELSRNDYTEAAQRRILLEEQLQRGTQELMQAEDELVKFATSEGIVSASEQASAAVERLETLQQREADLQVSLDGAVARETAARAKLTQQDEMAITGLTESRDPVINSLRQRILDLEQRIAEEKEVQGKSDQHPDVASLNAELASAQMQLAEVLDSEMLLNTRSMAVDPSYAALVSEALSNSQRVQELRASISALRGQKSELLDQLQRLPAQSRTYEGLRREAQWRGEAVARLTESYEMARLEEAGSTVKFSIIDEPFLPKKPASPSLKKAAAVSFGATMLMTTLLAFWLHGGRREQHEETAPTAS